MNGLNIKTLDISKALLGSVCLSIWLFSANLAHANDGVFDANNDFPAVGTVGGIVTISGELDYAGVYCSGSLIRDDIFLTAGHCQFYDTRRIAQIPGYEVTHYFVSFDSVVTDNDVFCYMHDIDHPNKNDVVCDQGSTNGVTFHTAQSVVHPNYATISSKGNGDLKIVGELIAKDSADLALLVLDEAIDQNDITPIATAPLGAFDNKQSFVGLPLTGVGYGLNYHKSIPVVPNQPGGDGPTVFEGDSGVRRIADLGTLRAVQPLWMVPTQQSALSEDSVCYGDSGSPLFFRDENGSVIQTVSGVLKGAALWCMGAYDPYSRVDTPQAVSFISCVKAASTEKEVCECGIEKKLGLCD